MSITILHILGIPIPLYVDGKILKNIFRKESELIKMPVHYDNGKSEKEEIRKKIRELKMEHKI